MENFSRNMYLGGSNVYHVSLEMTKQNLLSRMNKIMVGGEISDIVNPGDLDVKMYQKKYNDKNS